MERMVAMLRPKGGVRFTKVSLRPHVPYNNSVFTTLATFYHASVEQLEIRRGL